MKKERLLNRLDEIGKTLERKGGVLLLLGVGSVGIELERLDEFSDLDFFVIVEPGQKNRYVNQLDWLEETYPLMYSFKNSDVGCKIMFNDGIFAEYAIFEEWELENAAYTEGRIIWKAPNYTNQKIAKPSHTVPSIRNDSLDFPINEALTNLYVGLCRYARGERLSAMKFVQVYAVDKILSVLHLLEPEVEYFPDPFGNERRLEKRFPKFSQIIGDMLLGYDHIPNSAINILNFIEEIYPVNVQFSKEIRRLALQVL